MLKFSDLNGQEGKQRKGQVPPYHPAIPPIATTKWEAGATAARCHAKLDDASAAGRLKSGVQRLRLAGTRDPGEGGQKKRKQREVR